MDRVIAYIDGFNLYHRALKKRPLLKWLDIPALLAMFLRTNDRVEHINYYTSRIHSRTDPDQPKRQDRYLRALASNPVVSVHCGTFLTKTICRPLKHRIELAYPNVAGRQFVLVGNTSEKGADVKLASHLVRDALTNKFDAALVLTADTDLLEPLKIVKEDAGKPVVLVYPDIERRSAPSALFSSSSVVRFLSERDLKRAQFPNTVIGRNGKEIHRPAEWR